MSNARHVPLAIAVGSLITLSGYRHDSSVAQTISPQSHVSQSHVSQSHGQVAMMSESEDIDYMVNLGLIKGHLIVAKELLEMGEYEQAEPHIGHPVEEIYADLENPLNERGVPQFKQILINLHDWVKLKPNDPELWIHYHAALAAVERAIAALTDSKQQSPAFVLQVMNHILDTANAEYTAAISNGHIHEDIEYQDSRGFVLYVKNSLYPTIEATFAQEDQAANQDIKAILAELETAWPSVIPPNSPVVTPETVSMQVQTIAEISQRAIAAK